VHYFDSMARHAGRESIGRMKFLLQWLSDDSARVSPSARIDTSDWQVLMYEDDEVPQQRNGIDCGA
jgi:Ulp1 family protease